MIEGGKEERQTVDTRYFVRNDNFLSSFVATASVLLFKETLRVLITDESCVFIFARSRASRSGTGFQFSSNGDYEFYFLVYIFASYEKYLRRNSRLRKILIFIYESSRVESSEMRIRNIFSFVRKIFIHDAFDIRNSNGFFIYNIIIFIYVLELYD